MKNLFTKLVCIAALVGLTSFAGAEDLKSGPEAGSSLGAFGVEKVAGAVDDGVETGQELCYRCRNQQRPQVVVFTRSVDPKVTELITKLDKAMGDHEDEQLRVFVNVLNSNKITAKENAKKFAATNGVTHIPFVVPNQYANGPGNYKINEDAEVTITLANESEVKRNIAVAKASELDIAAVLADVEAMLK